MKFSIRASCYYCLILWTLEDPKNENNEWLVAFTLVASLDFLLLTFDQSKRLFSILS